MNELLAIDSRDVRLQGKQLIDASVLSSELDLGEASHPCVLYTMNKLCQDNTQLTYQENPCMSCTRIVVRETGTLQIARCSPAS